MSKFKRYLEEEWFGYSRYHGNEFDLWVNPSRQELQKIGRDVRFIADGKTKKIYIANAHNALHNAIWDLVRKESGDSRVSPYSGSLMPGEMFLGEIDLNSLVFMNDRELAVWTKTDWLWTKKWLPGIAVAIEDFKNII